MNSKLKILLQNTPNVVGSSILLMIARTLLLMIGVSLIVVGIGLIFVPKFQFLIIDFLMEDPILSLETSVENQIVLLLSLVGAVSIFVGSLLLTLRQVSGFVIRRNLYILDIRNWYYDELEKREQEEGKE